MFCLHIELFGSIGRILNTIFDVGSPEWMTGSIAAAAFEEVCLLGVSWTLRR